MKRQKVWILGNNNVASNPVPWVDPANPYYTDSLKGEFIEAEATIYNRGARFTFEDEEYQDADCEYNTKTIVCEKMMEILGCRTTTSLATNGISAQIIKKKRPQSYIFLKKPTFESSGGGGSTEDSDVTNATCTFKIKGTTGVMSDGGSYGGGVWKQINGDNYQGNYLNRLCVFFVDANNKVLLKENGKPIAYYILLTKGNPGEVTSHGSDFFEDFSGAVSDDDNTPAYVVTSAIYGTGEYRYSRYSNLNGAGEVSYLYNNLTAEATLMAQINHTFPEGTKMCVGLASASSYSSANSPSYATPAEVETSFPFTADHLSGTWAWVGSSIRRRLEWQSDITQSGNDWILNTSNHLIVQPMFFASNIMIDFTNPNADNSLTVANPYPFTSGANDNWFPMCFYDIYAAANSLPALSTFCEVTTSGGGGEVTKLTKNTPCWTFLPDIQRTRNGGQMVMKGTIRYLSYMADLQPEGDDYRDYKPFEVGE